jgi:ABC-type polysaccharide/polyol phosphate transport system ATPase subunit
MNDIAIRVKNLTKVYHLYDKPQDRLKEALSPFKKKYHHDFYAMNDVSFEIKKGETVGIIGKNGAGKSSRLKMITGVLTPTWGEI